MRTREHDRDVVVAETADDEVGEDADREPDDDAAGGDADELQRRAAEAEGAAGRDPDGDPVEDEGGAVVDHRLAFDQQPHPLGRAEAAEDRGRGDGVGRGEDGAEDRRLGPAHPRHQCVGDEGDDAGGDEDEADREQRQRPHHRPQLQRRGAPAGGVDQRRQEDEEDRVRLQFDARQAGDEGDREAAEDEDDRRRDLAEVGEADEQGRGEDEDEDRLDVVHAHITSGATWTNCSHPRWRTSTTFGASAMRRCSW